MTTFSKHIQQASVKPSPTRRLQASLFLAVLLSLTGCTTSTPPPQIPVADQQPVLSESAEALMRRAATASSDRAAELYLQAAWAYLDIEDFDGAEQAYTALEPAWLDQSLIPDYHLQSTRLSLHRGDAAAARQSFALVPPVARQSARALLISSALCSAEGRYTCALRQLIRATADDPSVNEEIWRLLNAELSMTNLDRISESGEPATLADWRALHRAVVTPFSLQTSRRVVQTWFDAHPDHPATLIPPTAVTNLLVSRAQPSHIALLLPLSGPLARAGEAVRDGFISASLMADASNWLTVSIYDTAAEPLPALYEKVLADGASLIVGPLQKSTAQALNALNPELPVLILNYLDMDAVPAVGVTQFGLAIEDEADSIARRLVADGVERALLFHNYDDWSLRARRTLTDLAASGALPLQLTVQPFTDMRTITEAVGTAMHVEGSQTRKNELASLLGTELEFLPRAREDVDAVVALIDNSEANALVPALRFHFANHLPVYASAQVARRARSGQLAELGGFHVSELPYFLSGDPLYPALAAPFELAENPFASLMALGADAFRLSERQRLSEETGDVVLLGSTGLLRRNPDGRVTRELAWGKVTGGVILPDRAPSTTLSGGGF